MATETWVPSPETLNGLARARIQFAERAYYIFNPHWSYSRSSADFVAIDKDYSHLFLVRAGERGIEVRRRHNPISKPLIIKTIRGAIGMPMRQRHYLPAYDFDEWTVWIDETEHADFHELLRQSGRRWRPNEQRSKRGKK